MILWRVPPVLAAWLTLTCIAGPSGAKDLDWVTSRDQLSAVAQLAAGYAGALACDRLVDTKIAGQFLQQHFGERVFSATEVSELMKILIGVQAAQRSLRSMHCAEVQRSFGARGTVIRGLVD